MTILEMLQQSAVLTLLGMAVVFLFLWIMVICVNLTGKILHSSNEEKTGLSKTKNQGKTEAEITAAITGAVNEYRK